MKVELILKKTKHTDKKEDACLGLADLGDMIKFHRKKSGLSQKGLANLAGIGKTAVFNIENHIKQPRLDTIAAVLAVLNIKVLFHSPIMASFEKQHHAQS